MSPTLRRSGPDDTPIICDFWREYWGDEMMVVHGAVYRPRELEGFIALEEGEWIGLVTYTVNPNECEIISLDSRRWGQGIGSSLVDAVVAEARAAGCRRVIVSTTNDNLEAIGFYQKRGFRLAAVHPGAVDRAREIKPVISLTGMHGIPLRDEIEFEMLLR